MQTFLSAQNSRVNYRVFFLTGPPLFSTKMKKGLTSQPEALSDEGFHGTAALVGSLAIFSFSTEQEGQLKKSPCNCILTARWPAIVVNALLF